MNSWFVTGEYLEKLIDLSEKLKSKNGVPFVMTYHPLLNCHNGLTRKNIFFLNMIPKCEDVFSSQTMVFFSSARKIFSYLI